MAALRKTHVTPEEYLALDRASEVKHEYIGGHVYAMSGASREHNLITTNIARDLSQQLYNQPCEVYGDMRVRVPKLNFVYPDVVVVCGEPQFGDDYSDILLNPTLVIEVLSPSTERYDRGLKFEAYRDVPSLREYVLVSQEKPLIERYARQPNGAWELTVFKQPLDSAPLLSIGCQLQVERVYNKVQFT